MTKYIAIPATKQVMPDDTFFAYLVTNGIEIAYMMIDVPDRVGSMERRYL